MSVIVIAYTTLDGIVTDPDGSEGTPGGGWLFGHGPEAVAGDRFKLGASLDEGVLLLGRTTWEQFSRLWPQRNTPFALRMNAASKLVASRTLTDVSAWSNSRLLEGDLVDTVKRERRDVVVMGSLGVARALMAEDLVDEYRLVTLPTLVGTGGRLFPADTSPVHLECLSVERAGPAVLTRYGRTPA